MHFHPCDTSTRSRFVLAGALALLVLCAPAGVRAQSDEEPIDSIRVTAQKREQSIYEVSTALSVLTPEEINARGVRNMVDLGEVVPNLTVTTFGGGSGASAGAFVRGIGLQDHLILTDPGVSVYLDDVYLGRQIAQNWSLADIKRVEILRGPQGTLWGRNSIGGSINIITRKPDDEARGRLALEAGSRARLNANLYGNAPLAENLFLSANLALKRRDGVGEFRNIPNASKEVGEQRDISGRVSLLWEPAERVSLLLSADGNDGRHGLNPYTTRFLNQPGCTVTEALPAQSDSCLANLFNPLISENPYDSNTGERALTATDNQAHGISATLRFDARENLSQLLRVSHRRSNYSAGLDDDSAQENYLSFPEVGEAEQTSIELQASGEWDALDFVVGAYGFRETGHNEQIDLRFKGAPGVFFIRQRAQSNALYANLGYRVRDNLHISGGARFTRDTKRARAVVGDPGPDTSAERTWREWNWKFAASWYLNERMTLYGNVANGYQSGAFPARPYCLFSDPACFRATDNITAINYEVGFRGAWGERLRAHLALFWTDYDNLPYQVGDTGSAGFNTGNLVVKQRSLGAEWESQLQLTEALSLQTSFGYIHTDVKSANPFAATPLTPAYTLAVGPEWSARLPGGGALTLRADYAWRDEIFGEPSSDPTFTTPLPSRALLNFSIRYRAPGDTFELGLYGRNVSDERYPHASLNTGDYILTILSNDPSEFGIQFTRYFTTR